MHNNEDLFYEIPTLSGIDSNEIISKYGNEQGNWNEYHGFYAKPLPQEYVKKDSFLSWLSKKYEVRLVLSYYPPYYLYNWHIGELRDVVLNLLFSHDGDSHCIFVRNYTKLNSRPGATSLGMFFEELKYKPSTYYLFNAGVYHAIWNLDKPRYLFSVEFADKRDKINYESVKKDIIDYYANGQKG